MHLRYIIFYDIGVLDKKICLYIYYIPMPPKKNLKSPTTVAKPDPSKSWFIEKIIHYLGCVLTRFSFSCQMIFLYIFLWTCKKLTPQPMVAPFLLPGTWFIEKKYQKHLNLPYPRMLPYTSFIFFSQMV